MTESRTIRLTHTTNTRDLGGIKTKNGQTRRGVFVRSDTLSWISKADKHILQELGLHEIVDLRSPFEIASEAIPDFSFPVIVHAIPLVSDSQPDLTKKVFSADTASMIGRYYIRWLESSSIAIKEVLETLALSCGMTLFNCHAGKDRTGLIAMLVLGIAACDDAAIIDDYQETYRNYETQFSAPPEIYRNSSDYMRDTLNYIHDNYGDVRGYLKAIDFREDLLNKIVAKFVETRVD